MMKNIKPNKKITVWERNTKQKKKRERENF